MKGETFGDTKKIAKKNLTKPDNMHKKLVGQGRDSNSCPFAWQTSKNPQKSEAEEATLAWQLVEASL